MKIETLRYLQAKYMREQNDLKDELQSVEAYLANLENKFDDMSEAKKHPSEFSREFFEHIEDEVMHYIHRYNRASVFTQRIEQYARMLNEIDLLIKEAMKGE